MESGFSPLAIPTPVEATAKFNLALDILLPLLLFPTIFLAHHIRQDYHAYLALGPGGVPSTPAGYLQICILRPFAVRNPLAPPSLPCTLLPQEGYLKSRNLPDRSGPRPKVVGIVPHRQTTQRASAEMYAALTKEIHGLVNAYPSVLYTGTSCFEKHSTGIFCKLGPAALSRQEQEQQQKRLTCNGEVCHAHPIDGSLHLTLHPADVRLVLEKGWGERHPIAREDWWWWRRSVPSGFVMIYAPRTEEERRCVVEIIRAAAWWVRGEALPNYLPE
ncbi:hypothetical protein BDV32DRAFT_111384 [Aspergillus pseudonomiae]|uniref:Luciferase domain-containing protein n=1 Tax=Aspergillus pseudonomiae TaxID=1506151 RepID=A0A5N7D188_9EURO|nr:uncharacterized protein BDV37DRAFT_219995 [Aspergillus pseudonomiae]KAB8255616.1 hypothetical protein BDV32DRAFT_111384 [Aspergillus pseudonomiae]KAE8399867.1 hypothetical protein BDV37DRAFT_219995 [Aspergillus pseudonomiae]